MNRPWSLQTILKKKSLPTQNDLLLSINTIPSLRDKALVAIAYLTAGRISEIVSQKELRKVIYKHKVVKGKKEFEYDNEGNLILDKIVKVPLNYPGICKKDIGYGFMENKKDGELKVMIISMQNRKNKEQARKNIPIVIEREKEFVDIIQAYIGSMDLETPLFPINKHRAYQIISKYMKMNCHFLRDIRLSHLVILYHRDGSRLKQFAGWHDLKPASRYVQLDWRDIWK
jgi:hypothetical protein